ncbi:MAG TPA: ABC transporter substrate-binding protein, partial [Gemmataceae bacterium]|nr:ABC transporter substrate-binding protein [Gemmataceae bacterium]
KLLTSAEKPDWDRAINLASELANTFNRSEDQARIVAPLADALQKAIDKGAPEEQMSRLRQIEVLFPSSNATNAARDKLKQKAQAMFDSAKILAKSNTPADSAKALAYLRQAEEMYPRLPELRDFRLGLENKMSVLRVGVRQLPKHLTPGLAFGDSEKQAVELMFESLIKLGADEDRNPRWVGGLIDGPPKLVPLGRQFQISRDAFWSNGKPVTPEDVRNTVRLLRNPKWPGHSSAWASLTEEPAGGDPTRVTLGLRQGYIDPLSLMAFKVLPVEPWPDQALGPADDQKFDSNPVGSGPYALKQRNGRTPEGRDFVSFAANPAYGSRPGKFGLPAIREVQFFDPRDKQTGSPFDDLRQKKLDLFIDLPNRDVASVQTLPWLTVQTMTSRRVYFLAVNHRLPKLENQDLRKALAHAIDREAILTSVFRPNLPPAVHRPLNGPFPAGCWACNPDLAYTPNLAKTLSKKFKDKEIKLSLKHPNDPEVARAMAELARQVQEAIGVTLTPEALPMDKLREHVEVTHNYELAYYWYDFPGPTYWLWPLFDPKGTGDGGTNFLGYQNDGALESQFGMIMSRREFSEVRKMTRLLHEMLFDKMPLVPLWQLDTHIVLHKDLQATISPLTISDPLLVFTDVDQWRFDKK